MENNQIELLARLANKIKTEKKDRNKIVISLESAKILTGDGNVAGHYPHLNKLITITK